MSILIPDTIKCSDNQDQNSFIIKKTAKLENIDSIENSIIKTRKISTETSTKGLKLEEIISKINKDTNIKNLFIFNPIKLHFSLPSLEIGSYKDMIMIINFETNIYFQISQLQTKVQNKSLNFQDLLFIKKMINYNDEYKKDIFKILTIDNNKRNCTSSEILVKSYYNDDNNKNELNNKLIKLFKEIVIDEYETNYDDISNQFIQSKIDYDKYKNKSKFLIGMLQQLEL